jgi:acetyl-CoA carboxylase beta subunit
MICANKECAKEFEAKTHNQKYCSDECCRIATNRRIMEKYYEKKAIKNGAVRNCKKCKAQLSRYNAVDICQQCEHSTKIKSKNKLDGLIDEIKRIN